MSNLSYYDVPAAAALDTAQTQKEWARAAKATLAEMRIQIEAERAPSATAYCGWGTAYDTLANTLAEIAAADAAHAKRVAAAKARKNAEAQTQAMFSLEARAHLHA